MLPFIAEKAVMSESFQVQHIPGLIALVTNRINSTNGSHVKKPRDIKLSVVSNLRTGQASQGRSPWTETQLSCLTVWDMYSITCRYWWFSCPLPVSFSSCPSGVIFLAFVLCWLPYSVDQTMKYGSKSAGAGSLVTNIHVYANTPPESTGNMASVTEPVRLSDLDLKTQAHTGRDDVVSHNVRAGESTHNLGPHTETDTHSEIHNTTQNTTLCIKLPPNGTHYNTATAILISVHIDVFQLVAWTLSRLSPAINPLVYNLMSARYRHAVRSLVHTHCLTPSHRLSTTPSSG